MFFNLFSNMYWLVSHESVLSVPNANSFALSAPTPSKNAKCNIGLMGGGGGGTENRDEALKRGALEGGPPCRMSILRNGHVPCHEFGKFEVNFKIDECRMSNGQCDVTDIFSCQ